MQTRGNSFPLRLFAVVNSVKSTKVSLWWRDHRRAKPATGLCTCPRPRAFNEKTSSEPSASALKEPLRVSPIKLRQERRGLILMDLSLKYAGTPLLPGESNQDYLQVAVGVCFGLICHVATVNWLHCCLFLSGQNTMQISATPLRK